MKDALDVRSTFEQNHDPQHAGAALHPAARYLSGSRVTVPLRPVHDSEPAQENLKPLSEFAVWMIFLAYLAVILTVGYLVRAHFTSS